MPKSKVPALSPAVIKLHFEERYASIETKLDEWEISKASFLVDVGRECLTLIRQTLEPMADHDLTGRKAARARLVKEIEEALPEVDGIGAPQVNRWVRWAGVAECVGNECT